jgi:hypothetical protein
MKPTHYHNFFLVLSWSHVKSFSICLLTFLFTNRSLNFIDELDLWLSVNRSSEFERTELIDIDNHLHSALHLTTKTTTFLYSIDCNKENEEEVLHLGGVYAVERS